MSLNLNRVILAGNLTRDPQVRFLANELAVAEFGLAINRRFKDANGEAKEETTFVDVECWGRTAELVGQYLVRGSGCFLEGRLKLDVWDDRETGAKRSKLRVVADNIQFTTSKDPGERQEHPADEPAATPPRRPTAPAASVDDENSPPF